MLKILGLCIVNVRRCRNSDGFFFTFAIRYSLSEIKLQFKTVVDLKGTPSLELKVNR